MTTKYSGKSTLVDHYWDLGITKVFHKKNCSHTARAPVFLYTASYGYDRLWAPHYLPRGVEDKWSREALLGLVLIG